jgi:D-inositol-3-phosphate glycosyltransferase
MSGIAARDLKTEWDVPIVHMFHTLGLMKQRVARGFGEVEGDYRLEGEQEVLRLADRIISPTLAEVAQLQWLYLADTEKVVVIPPGVDLSHFYPIPLDEAMEFIGVAPCEQVLLYVGRIEPLKGIDTLIESLAIVQDQGVRVCLSVIGGNADGSEETLSAEMARLQHLREKYGLLDLVTFLGKRGQDTLPYYYSAAKAVVVPSLYESFGMVALEAMACGTPVVASQVGGLAFLVQDGVTGYTVPVDDPREMANRLLTLVSDPTMREQMGENAAAFAKDYGWQVIAGKVVEVYQELL